MDKRKGPDYIASKDSAAEVDDRLPDNVILDGSRILDARRRGIHEAMKPYLAVVEVKTHGFDNKTHIGQVVVHRHIAGDTVAAFDRLYEAKLPIKKVVPVGNGDMDWRTGEGWTDEIAMSNNKTSGYCPRDIEGSGTVSEHTKGLALDINPLQNPCQHADGRVEPAGAQFDPKAKGAILPGSEAVAAMNELGWEWGGFWPGPEADVPPQYSHHYAYPTAPRDRQHFQLNDDRRDEPIDLPDFSNF